jgi:hypothetical protein
MFHLYIVFANGHTIFLKEFERKEDALYDLTYHEQRVGETEIKFEVWKEGVLHFASSS